MRDDPALRFRTREEIIAVARDALDRAEAVRDRYFEHYDIPGCAIEEINPIDAASTAMAYYRPPAVDGSRPGAFCLGATDPGERYRYEYEALAFHESVPGHHLQLATAQTLDIPRYRRHLDAELCAFNEGWGLYAESLADEIGLYSDPVARLGMLSFAALRACRLVVDTGLHHLGWSRGQAIDFMYTRTATTPANARGEIDRYIAWPGQALAYLTGKREITRLRERAQHALGPRFELRRFHHAVLRNGAIPLNLLDEEIGRWTATESGYRSGDSVLTRPDFWPGPRWTFGPAWPAIAGAMLTGMDYAQRPMLVFWETTRACLLACQHCRASATSAPPAGELTTAEGYQLIDQVAGFGRPYPILVLTGGDCLLRPDIFDLTEYAASLGIPVCLSPSVTPLLDAQMIARIAGSSVKAVSISLDGACAATHDGVRGIPGHFTATVAAIRDLVAAGVTVQVNTVVMTRNADELADIAALVAVGTHSGPES